MELFATRAPWFVAGPLIGLLVVVLLWATNRPFGALGGYIDLLAWLRKPSGGIKHTVFMLTGIVLGGFLSALAAGGAQSTWAYGSFDARFGVSMTTRLGMLVLAGALMGYGTRMASGCTSGHGVCGTALGSPRSLVSTAVFMAAAVIAANVAAMFPVSAR